MHPALRISVTCIVLSLAACDSSITADIGDAKNTDAEWKPIWADAANAELRPGKIISDTASNCTAGFLFVDPISRSYYLGTAAHCAGDELHEDGTGLRISLQESIGTFVTIIESRREIGTVVFDSDSPDLQQKFGVDPDVDFALILLDPDINLIANPQVVSIEAPNGFVDCADIAAGDRMSYYGNGLVYGGTEPTRKREGAVVTCERGIFVTALPAISGDSGGPTVYNAGGKALGIVSALDLTNFLPGTIIGCTLPYCLREAAKAGFGNVALATIDGGFVGLSE